ncbi:MAG: two-component system response regulator KdpE [Brachymonas sp.]|jgi:two-component system KDP operon response regulator KdpE|nr:two-component system response regulator KdpE [Brachymonas sp.]MBP8794464.1 two-component system response regulator KdpE [Brachymonas sp.]MBP8820568.1 two-component system response regulator KdpE [Brachymonas sp.]MBP9651379.1 two-component system response regulator KdpE [Brachymonas sp.]
MNVVEIDPRPPAPVVLLVEDELHIRRFLRSALEGEGCRVWEAATLQRGLLEAASRQPDLVILDLGLPDGDGVQLVQELRSWSQLPVLILSARSDEINKVRALDAGADDYLTKPFGIPELLARVRALLRRSQRMPEATPLLCFGEIELDLARRQVLRAGEEVHLTPIEYRLLMYLAGNAGRVLTQRQLLQEVWGPNHTGQAHYLRVYMANLRRKLEADPARPRYLLTESGVGYRLLV